MAGKGVGDNVFIIPMSKYSGVDCVREHNQLSNLHNLYIILRRFVPYRRFDHLLFRSI